MTSSRKSPTTVKGPLSATAWKLVKDFRYKTQSTDTRGVSSEGKVLVQGRIVGLRGADTQLVVMVDPGSVDRKLAIRRMNDQLEGRSPSSNTDVEPPR